MAIYVKWNYRDIGSGNDILRESLAKLSSLTDELSSVHRQLDPQISSYEMLGRSFQTLTEGMGESAQRLRYECNALDSVIAVYADAERTVMLASESLPTSITERGLVFEGWFTDLLR